MTNWLDRLPIPPQNRLAALIAAIAVGSTMLFSCCCGGCVLLVGDLRKQKAHDQKPPSSQVETRPGQPDDLPPEVAKKVQTVLSDKHWSQSRAARATETPRQTAELQQLVEDSRRMLVAAADDKAGEIVVTDRPFSIRVGGTYFCKSEEGPRVAALWRLALSVFVQEGWLEYSHTDSSPYTGRPYSRFRLTVAGYALADEIAK